MRHYPAKIRCRAGAKHDGAVRFLRHKVATGASMRADTRILMLYTQANERDRHAADAAGDTVEP